jgi:hypothetical protein
VGRNGAKIKEMRAIGKKSGKKNKKRWTSRSLVL